MLKLNFDVGRAGQRQAQDEEGTLLDSELPDIGADVGDLPRGSGAKPGTKEGSTALSSSLMSFKFL